MDLAEYLAAALGTDNKCGNIIVNNSKLGLYKKSFVHRGSVLWNRLQKNLRTTKKVSILKKNLRKWVAEDCGEVQ